VAEADGWEMPEAIAREFAASLPSWRPFADTNRALSRLAGVGIRLGILSNVDDDLLAGTREHFTVDFDLVITAEQVRSYKPEHGHFLAARERLGDAHWLHAAQSYFHDVVPCAELGIPSAWINRHGEPPAGNVRPDYEFRDLAGLAAWLVP
jgi:FMN phosphatase YigB (HAD superfamily)